MTAEQQKKKASYVQLQLNQSATLNKIDLDRYLPFLREAAEILIHLSYRTGDRSHENP